MDTKMIITATLSFAVGAAAGFAVGYFFMVKNEEEIQRVYANDIKKNPVKENPQKAINKAAEAEFPQDDDPDDPPQLISSGPAHIARKGQNGVNYAKVQKIVEENGYTDPEDIQRVVEDPDNEETAEEMEERARMEDEDRMSEYRKKNKDKIVPIQSDEWDTDFPEVDYEHKDLYYFVNDDVLTDDDGNPVDEEEYIGKRPRQFGWMSNDEEKIYIRNNPKETDFQVWKHKCSSEEFWS